MIVGRLVAVVTHPAHQLDEVARERVRGHVGGAPQRRRRQRIGAGGTPDAEIDAPGVQRLEHGELLRDHERGVVGEHHAAGSDVDGRRGRGEVGDQHRR
jgi:hypothetical protein